MKTRIIDLIKKTKYFTDNNIEIDDISKITEDKYRLKASDKEFELDLINTNEYLDLYSEINYKKLKEIGANPKHTYEIGLFPELNKTYILSEYRNEISLLEFLSANDKNSNYKLGVQMGEILKNLHKQQPGDDIDWYKSFLTKANYLFYIHGVNEVGDKDYILIDYINSNKHLTKNLKTSYLYQNLDYNHVFVTEDKTINLEGLDFNTIGDRVFDFPQINLIAITSEAFAKGLLDVYFNKSKPPIKFFRLLCLYQAYEILDSIVAIRAGKESKLTTEEINALLAMYDYFNQDVPNWT